MMIVALLIRNFKIYQNINFLPISNGKMFSALVGENGAGKSSVLEALNSFFNGVDWNYNHTITLNSFDTREPFICPIFLIDKQKPIFSKHKDIVEELSSMVWRAPKAEFNSAHRKISDQFCRHRDFLIQEGFSPEDYYLLPLGLRKQSANGSADVYFSIFEPLENIIGEKPFVIDQKIASEIYENLSSAYNYVYLPSEIDFHAYTKIEGRTIQALLGRKLNDIVREFIDGETVRGINRNLNAFLTEIAETLEGYEYKKPAKKQNLFNQSHFTEKVIEAFFESKVLSRKNGEESTPVNNLSSGEKRRAIIDVARGFLLKGASVGGQQVVLAIDEPELSLHISACFEQFEKVKEISTSGVQSLVTTHWYGFMPVISSGVAVYIPKDDRSEVPLIDLRCFREDIKRLKERTSGILPTNIELKGINDLVQSIIASVTASDCNWVICEGSSDKIYLDHFFKGLPVRPYVLAVGGSANVKRVFNYVTMALDNDRDCIQGKVYFVVDTDKKYSAFEAPDSIKNIRMRRLINNPAAGKTELVVPSGDMLYPPTEIEDCLLPDIFISTLQSFQEEQAELYSQFSEPPSVLVESQASGLALNMRDTDKQVLEQMFAAPRFKVMFANRYVSLSGDTPPPGWVLEISQFLGAEKKLRRRPSAKRSGRDRAEATN
jgi:ABC-type dipeptide/oligopeptide/nickel transport system ATPase component